MTTAEFIKKTYNTTNDKWGKHGYDRWCSSVKTDKHGTVYSYGSHYPLAFHVAGLDFINEQGYSNTTSKHIGWARAALNYNYVGVKLNREEAVVIGNEYITDDNKLIDDITPVENIYECITITSENITELIVSNISNHELDTIKLYQICQSVQQQTQ